MTEVFKENGSTAPVLPVVLPPLVGESLRGYIVRLTQANGYERANWIHQLCGEKFLASGNTAMARLAVNLATLTGQEYSKIKPLVCIPASAGNKRTVLYPTGERLDVSDLCWPSTQFCPQCIAEFGTHLAAWDLRLFGARPRHKIALLKECHSCRTKYSLRGKNVFQCRHCKTDLRLAPRREVSGLVVSLMRLLASKTGGPYQYSLLDVSEEWKAMPLSAFIATIKLLYRLHPDQESTAIYDVWYQDTRILLDVARCVLEWPTGLISYLDKIRDKEKKRPVPKSEGMRSSFGRLYLKVVNEDNHGNYVIIRDFLKTYVHARGYQDMLGGRGGEVPYTTRNFTVRSL